MTEDQLAGVTEEYLRAYRRAKAAFKAWDATQDANLFEEALQAAGDFTLKRIRYVSALKHTPGAYPPDPKTDT